jgi:hypothetical protein
MEMFIVHCQTNVLYSLQLVIMLDFPLLLLSMDQIHFPFPKQGTFTNELTLFQISLLVCGKTIFLKTSVQHLQKALQFKGHWFPSGFSTRIVGEGISPLSVAYAGFCECCTLVFNNIVFPQTSIPKQIHVKYKFTFPFVTFILSQSLTLSPLLIFLSNQYDLLSCQYQYPSPFIC